MRIVPGVTLKLISSLPMYMYLFESDNIEGQTERGGRIGRALVLRAEDRWFKPRSSQTNDLSN